MTTYAFYSTAGRLTPFWYDATGGIARLPADFPRALLTNPYSFCPGWTGAGSNPQPSLDAQTQGEYEVNEVVVGPKTWVVVATWDRNGAGKNNGQGTILVSDSATSPPEVISDASTTFPEPLPQDGGVVLLRGSNKLWTTNLPASQEPIPLTTGSITTLTPALQRSLDTGETCYGLYYTFVVTDPGVYTIDVQSVSLSDEDTYLYLFKGSSWAGRDSSFNNPPGVDENFDRAGMLYNDDDLTVIGVTFNSKLITDTVTLAAGTYTIEATTSTPGVTGDITVQVRAGAWPNPDAKLGPPGSETPTALTIDAPDTAWTLDGLTQGAQRSTDLSALALGAYFKFTVVTPGDYTIHVAGGFRGIATYTYLFKGDKMSHRDPSFNNPPSRGIVGHDRSGMFYADDSDLTVTLSAGTYLIEATTESALAFGAITVGVASGGGGGGGGLRIWCIDFLIPAPRESSRVMSTKSFTLTIEAPSHRNPVAIAMQKRYGGGKRVMKDRRTPRGGASNKQRAYREGSY